jgi:iron complex transport system ATP-binding protein
MTSLHTTDLCIEIGNKQVCNNLHLTIHSGQIWGVLGRNGIGKTTLLHTLAGLKKAKSGHIFINGKNITALTRRQIAQQLGLLLQHVEDPFPSTVLETVLTGRHPHISNWQWESSDDYLLATKALAQVEMQGMSNRLVNHLSGGERQRVSIATLITQNPDILLLDEPNSHLDLNYQINLITQICATTKEKQGIVVMNLHDINLASRFCDHLLFLLGDGKILAGKARDLLNPTNLGALFQHPIYESQGPKGKIYTPA